MIDLLYILAFTVGFSLFDYFAYNISAKKGWTNGLLAPYRIAQTCVQIILIAIAWAFVNGIVAIGFTLLWWTWGCDWIFHIFCFTDLFNDRQYVSKGYRKITYTCKERNDSLNKYYDYDKQEYKCVLYWKSISWAWWTPYGLIDLLINGKNGSDFRVIHWSKLAMQSMIGIIITITITLC